MTHLRTTSLGLLSLAALTAAAAAPYGPPVPTPTPAAAPAPATPLAATPAAVTPTYDAFGFLRAMAAKRAADPIGPIADRMSTVTDQLADLQTDQPVQERQQAVAGQLDAIIKAMEKQMKSGGGGANPNPTKPMQRSQITKGPGGQGPLHDARSGTKLWGQLRPGDRQQITQSQTEGFPPGYEQVLEGYYSRLSQEQVNNGDAAATPAPAGPATQPAGR